MWFLEREAMIFEGPEASGPSFFAPKSVPRPFVSLLAPGFAQDRPQDASKKRSWEPPGSEKKLGARPGPPQDNFPAIFCRSQNRTPPRRGGGHAAQRSLQQKNSFLESLCFRLGWVQKSRVQGLGGEAKASPTTSFVFCLKLRFAKLEAPLRGAGGDLTTARPVGRRIFIDISPNIPDRRPVDRRFQGSD